MLKLLICDWDGTIADSVEQIINCKKYLAARYELPLPRADTIRTVLGQDFKEAMKICFPTADTIQFNQLCEEFHELMQSPRFQASLFPHAEETLKQLNESGIKLAIATSKSRGELDQALKSLSTGKLFDITCCAEESQPKPSPIMLQSICEQLSIPPEQSVMLGDTISDVLCAQNAGMKIICVNFGAHPHNKLTTYSPNAFINNWQELPQAMDNLIWN